MTDAILAAIHRFVTQRAKWSIFLSIVLTLVLLPQIRHLRSDFSYRIWFAEDDPLLTSFDAFERKFGNDENVAILIETPEGIFTPESVRLLQTFTEKMWLAPEVIRVDSITNHNFTEATEDDIKVDPFLPSGEELSEVYLQTKKQLALRDEVIPRYLMSPDAKSAMIYAKMKPALEKIPMYKDTVDYARAVARELDDGTHKFHITGSGTINVSFQEVSEADMKAMIPVLVVLVIALLIYAFRGVLAVFYSFLIIGLSIGTAMAIGAASGYTFNVMISAVPSTLIAICIADVIHIMMSYFIYRRRGYANSEALDKTLDKNLVPTFVTSLTTSIGFFSLAPAKIKPVAHMGILDGYGTILAWVFTIFLVIPLLRFFPLKGGKKSEDQEQDSKTDTPYTWASSYARFLQEYRNLVIVVSAVLCIASVFFALKTEVNSDPFNYFTEKVPLKIANIKMEQQIGGSMGAEIAIDSGVADGIKAPEFLEKMQRFQDWLLAQEYIKKVVSVVDIIKSMNRSLNGGEQSFYKIADSQEMIAQQLFLYNMSLPQGMDMNHRISLDNRSTRLTLMMDIHDSKRVLYEFDRMENYAKSIGLNAEVTGKVPLYQRMNSYIVETFFESMSMALILVSLVMIAVFRSWKIGLLSMIPNTVPLIFGVALMYFLNKPIDMGTVVIISVCLGIAVDDTVHFLANYLKYRRAGINPEESVARVLSFTGPALVLTTVILVFGFGTFIFANFIPNINFGIMTASILSAALVVDLTLLPALLLTKR